MVIQIQSKWMERKRERRTVDCEFQNCGRLFEKIRARTLVVSWPGSEKKWYGTHTYKPNGKWDPVAEDMMLNFSERGHTVFRASSALERGNLKCKGEGKLSIHFCDDGRIRGNGSSHDHLRQFAQYLRSSSGHVRRAGLQNH